jgi:hypothetical protein
LKCGDKGFTTANGAPCGQNIGADARGCVWHTADAEGRRALALKGGIASRLRTVVALPGDTPPPVLDSPAAVRAELAATIDQVRTGRLDHRIGAVVINGIATAIKLAELEVAAQIGDLERRFRLRRV